MTKLRVTQLSRDDAADARLVCHKVAVLRRETMETLCKKYITTTTSKLHYLTTLLLLNVRYVKLFLFHKCMEFRSTEKTQTARKSEPVINFY